MSLSPNPIDAPHRAPADGHESMHEGMDEGMREGMRDAADQPGSLDTPIEMVRRAMARLRGARWILVAVAIAVIVLLVSQRVTVAEAVLTFGFLTLATLIGLPGPTARRPTAPRRLRARPTSRPSFEQMIASWPQPVVLIDHKRVIRTINAAAADLLEIRKTGDPLSFRLRDPDLLAAVDEALTAGREATHTLLEKVPSERRLRLHVRPFSYSGSSDLSHVGVRRGDGPVRFVLLVIEDETATHRTERMRSDFVANASHELRTPLASISGCIETLQGPARDDPAGQERFLTIMSQQADRMTALIDDLLSLNRIEMRAHRLPTDCVDLEATVREAVDAARPAADIAKVSIGVEALASPPTVRGDAPELRQVATNLLQNAIKYGAEGGRIDISLRDALESGVRMIELEIRDYGAGIAPEHLPRLTERFYRAHVDTNPLASGTGLGLAIVKHIVARHRGRLLVDSTPGQGARFRVRLPFLHDQPQHRGLSEKGKEEQSARLSHD